MPGRVVSFVGWLDHSEAEQRQVRELLQLFSEKGTVDDLGIGTIRDSISNRLFPGTSVIQSRARYFLFVPWIFERAEQRHPADLVKKAELMERKLIPVLQQGADKEGLIGSRAGKDVRTLPSAIYWTGLTAYGIFLRPGMTRAQYGRAARRGLLPVDTEDELADRSPSSWHRSIPAAPEELFEFDRERPVDFALTAEEARWLLERVLSTEKLRGPNLLGSYASDVGAIPTSDDGYFWDLPLPEGTTSGTRELVAHAQRFSAAVEGASLLYNVLLHDERNDDDEGDSDSSAELRARFGDWADASSSIDLETWAGDLSSFWSTATASGRLPRGARAFVDDWCSMLHRKPLAGLLNDSEAHTLIIDRERRHKKAQARFGNAARLRSWRGDSGLAPLDFRWGQVRRFLRDIRAGLQLEDAGAVTDASNR